jgi:hypothetical protein
MSTTSKRILRLLLTGLAVSLYSIFVTSCGVRKVEKSITEESSVINTYSVDKKDIMVDKETNIAVNEELEEIQLMPIDTSKVIIVNGKSYKNVIVTIKKRNTSSLSSVKELIRDNSIKIDSAVVKINKVVTDKKSERTASIWWHYILLIFIILMLILIFLRYHSNK